MSPVNADDTDEYFDMDLDDSLLVDLISPEALDRGKGKRPAEDLPTPFAKRSAHDASIAVPYVEAFVRSGISEVEAIVVHDDPPANPLSPGATIAAAIDKPFTKVKRSISHRRNGTRVKLQMAFPLGKILLTPLLADGSANPSTDRSKILPWVTSVPELIQDGAVRIVLTTMVLDLPWLLQYIPRNTPLTIAKHWKGTEGAEEGTQFLSDYITIVNPPMPKASDYCCVHGKLWIIEYPTFVRVVIGSANLIEFDWSIVENTVFVQDFPLIERLRGSTNRLGCEFRLDMRAYLTALAVHPALVPQLEWYNFTAVRARIISTTHGSKRGADKHNWGLGKLGKVVKEIFPTPREPCEMTCQTSSLGSLDDDWLKVLHAVSRGYDLDEVIALEDKSMPDVTEKVQILFPSKNTVKLYDPGMLACSSFFLADANYKKTSWPRSTLREGISRRGCALMHVKMIIADLRGEEEPQSKQERKLAKNKGWVYLGSHNLTKAAWGCLRGGLEPALACNNYEIGVLFPLVEGLFPPLLTEEREMRSPDLDEWVPSWLPVAWQDPPRRYEPDEKPWMVNARDLSP